MVHSVRERIRKLRLSINYRLIVQRISLLKQRMSQAASRLLAKTSTTEPKGFAASLVNISRLRQWLERMNVNRKK